MPPCTCIGDHSATIKNCLQCHRSKLPRYNISNLLTSDIARLLSKKEEIFGTEICQELIARYKSGELCNTNTSTNSLVDNDNAYSDNNNALPPSIQILSTVHVDIVNEAHDRYKPTLNSMASDLDNLLKSENKGIDFAPLVNSPLLRCIGKLLGCCSKEIKQIDKREGHRCKHDPKTVQFYSMKRDFIRFLYRTKKPLLKKADEYRKLLTSASFKLDSNIYLNSENFEGEKVDKLANTSIIKLELTRLQKIILINANVVCCIDELVDNNYTCVGLDMDD